MTDTAIELLNDLQFCQRRITELTAEQFKNSARFRAGEISYERLQEILLSTAGLMDFWLLQRDRNILRDNPIF